MFKIILVITIVIVIGLGLFFYFKTPKTKLENPIGQSLGKVLGFEKNKPTDNQPNLLTQTKDSLEKNTQNRLDSVKTIVYNEVKTTLDNVFDKQATNDKNITEVTVNVLGVTNTDSNKPSYTIDLAKDSDLKIDLAVNTKYYLKFQNIPQNFCLYIANNKYPISGGIVEIQFTKVGNYPIKANSCDLNDKNIGTLSVQ